MSNLSEAIILSGSVVGSEMFVMSGVGVLSLGHGSLSSFSSLDLSSLLSETDY